MKVRLIAEARCQYNKNLSLSFNRYIGILHTWRTASPPSPLACDITGGEPNAYSRSSCGSTPSLPGATPLNLLMQGLLTLLAVVCTLELFTLGVGLEG